VKQIRVSLWLIGVLLVAMALSGCGQRTAEVNPTTAPAAQATETQAAETAATPAAQQGLPPAADDGLSLTDKRGNTVTLAGPAQRIVSLAPSNTEILFFVGAGGQVVGRDTVSDFPAAALAVPDIGGGFGELAMETIIAARPDLVLASDINAPEQIAALQDVGLAVYVLPDPVTLDDMYANLRTVATLTGHEAETEAAIAGLQTRVAAVLERTAGVAERPLVFYELDSTDPNAPWTAGPGTFVDMLIQMSGGNNAGAALDGAWAQISVERLVVEDPDIIVLGDSAYGATPETVAARAGWGTLSAVRNNAIYTFDDNLASRPGPRLVDGLEAMARLLHPGLFE